jgi:putative ABC transport system permease protein
VLVDIADRDKLGVSIGSNAEINGKKVHVAGFTEGLRGIGSINVISSLSTARHLDPGLHHTDDVAYYLVKLRAGADPAAVKDALSPKEQNARYQAWTAKEFGDRSTNYWLFESGMGTAFGLSSLVAVIVAIVITSQTLMAAVAASIREFATLRALGAPGSHLRSVVLQQALWVGMVGLVVAGLVSALILWLAKLAYIPVSVSVPITTGCAVLVLCVAILSGFVALSQLSKAAPAALLR